MVSTPVVFLPHYYFWPTEGAFRLILVCVATAFCVRETCGHIFHIWVCAQSPDGDLQHVMYKRQLNDSLHHSLASPPNLARHVVAWLLSEPVNIQCVVNGSHFLWFFSYILVEYLGHLITCWSVRCMNVALCSNSDQKWCLGEYLHSICIQSPLGLDQIMKLWGVWYKMDLSYWANVFGKAKMFSDLCFSIFKTLIQRVCNVLLYIWRHWFS